jgi:hypothetical protein
MVFVPPVTAVGGELVSYFNPDTVNIEVFDENDVSLGTTTAASSPGDGTFWGVASSVPIGRINMLTPTNQAEGMDNVTFGSPVGCSSPEDLPWISVAPDSGSTAPMSTTPVTVSFSAGVLPPGTYDGLLCLDSNDPDTPTLEVPVSLTVDSMPFLDGFETGDTSRWTLTIP